VIDEKLPAIMVMWRGDDGTMHTVTLGADKAKPLLEELKRVRKESPELTEKQALQKVLEELKKLLEERRADEDEE